MFVATVSLDAARRAGNASCGVEGKGVFNIEGRLAAAAGRDRSRRIYGVHSLMTTRRPAAGVGYPHAIRVLFPIARLLSPRLNTAQEGS